MAKNAYNGPTLETRKHADSADHRATIVPPPISHRLRIIAQTMHYPSSLLVRRGPDNQVATGPAD